MSTIIATPKPVVQPSVLNLFIAAVREGNYVNHYNVIADDLQDAIKRVKIYCEKSGARRRFVHVRPFILDMEHKLNEETKSD